MNHFDAIFIEASKPSVSETEVLAAVITRGQRLGRRRRIAKAVVGTAALAAVAGAGVGLAGTRGTQVGTTAAPAVSSSAPTSSAGDPVTQPSMDMSAPRGHVTVNFSDADPTTNRASVLAGDPYRVTDAQGKIVEGGLAGYYGFSSTQRVGSYRIDIGKSDCVLHIEVDTSKAQYLDAAVAGNAPCGTSFSAAPRAAPVEQSTR